MSLGGVGLCLHAPPLPFGHFPVERGKPGSLPWAYPCVRFAPRPLSFYERGRWWFCGGVLYHLR